MLSHLSRLSLRGTLGVLCGVGAVGMALWLALTSPSVVLRPPHAAVGSELRPYREYAIPEIDSATDLAIKVDLAPPTSKTGAGEGGASKVIVLVDSDCEVASVRREGRELATANGLIDANSVPQEARVGDPAVLLLAPGRYDVFALGQSGRESRTSLSIGGSGQDITVRPRWSHTRRVDFALHGEGSERIVRIVVPGPCPELSWTLPVAGSTGALYVPADRVATLLAVDSAGNLLGHQRVTVGQSTADIRCTAPPVREGIHSSDDQALLRREDDGKWSVVTIGAYSSELAAQDFVLVPLKSSHSMRRLEVEVTSSGHDRPLTGARVVVTGAPATLPQGMRLLVAAQVTDAAGRCTFALPDLPALQVTVASLLFCSSSVEVVENRMLRIKADRRAMEVWAVGEAQARVEILSEVRGLETFVSDELGLYWFEPIQDKSVVVSTWPGKTYGQAPDLEYGSAGDLPDRWLVARQGPKFGMCSVLYAGAGVPPQRLAVVPRGSSHESITTQIKGPDGSAWAVPRLRRGDYVLAAEQSDGALAIMPIWLAGETSSQVFRFGTPRNRITIAGSSATKCKAHLYSLNRGEWRELWWGDVSSDGIPLWLADGEYLLHAEHASGRACLQRFVARDDARITVGSSTELACRLAVRGELGGLTILGMEYLILHESLGGHPWVLQGRLLPHEWFMPRLSAVQIQGRYRSESSSAQTVDLAGNEASSTLTILR